MDCPANGPGSGPFGVCTVATTGSPTASGAFTSVMFAAKYCANRVSTKMRSPMFCSAGVTSSSVSNCGAFPEPHPESPGSKTALKPQNNIPNPLRRILSLIGRFPWRAGLHN